MKICMIAGWGRYPVYVAKALRNQGFEVHCFGVVGHADGKALADICTSYHTMGMCRFGKPIRFMLKNGITDFITLGKYHKWRLFQPLALFRHFPDFLTLRAFAAHFITQKQDCRDDTLMLAISRLFGKYGLKLGVPTDFVPELLVGESILTQVQPTPTQWRDIRFGMSAARELGRFDIGQSVVLAGGVVVAVEGIEGTDACIQRAGQLCARGGLILVKVAKPNQDMRFDVPTIGLQTLENFHAARGSVIAIEAEKTILIDREEVVRFANSHGIAICAVKKEME